MPSRFETALASTGYAFRHWAWSHAPGGDYGVWREYSGEDLEADNVHAEQGTRCYVHLFTRDDSSAPRRKVEAALTSLRAAWRLESTQYEEDTGYIHFEWRVGLRGDLLEEATENA